ncbi:MAG: glycosyltransferase family 2 protein [Candidatus Delongbacteria bacterium]|nr:glycosyltransferase family 2 protein [Candidatus Delongbacteria bacterium]MBN2834352.1 glycosyltransferase family 2 protein [Candidatus Delongbacteria bacterium]
MNKSVSIIIPAFNEELCIGDFLKELDVFMRNNYSDYEIIVVDDCSTDNTSEILKSLDFIRYLRNPYNKGNGATVRTGIRNATKDYVVMMDSDGQHKPEDIKRITDKLEDYDCVVGARTSNYQGSVHRNLANSFYNYLATYVTNLKIQDLTSGFRGFKRSIIIKFLYLFPNGFSYPTTSTMAIIKSGYNLCYVPIDARPRIGKSKIKLLRDGFRFLIIIMKVATLFSPLKVFLPISFFFFLSSMIHGFYKIVFVESRYTQFTVVLFTLSILFFLIGLLSEQISTLRFDRVEEE